MKKGQGGGGAANLILIIGAMILIYVLFLSADDRDSVLGKDSNDVVKVGDDQYERVLLDEQPGTLLEDVDTEFWHSLPTFILRTDEEDRLLRSIDSVYIDNTESSRVIPVLLDQRPESGVMTFEVEDHSGTLTVLLNDEQVFKGDLEGAVDPIRLPLRKENVVEFRVDKSSGWQFWKSNFYDIRNVQIVGTVIDTDEQEAVSSFFVSREEANAEAFDNAYVIYLADCRSAQVGRLSVFMNDVLLSSRIPECGELDQTTFDPRLLREGRNELTFSTTEGTYLIDRLAVRTFLADQQFPLYFFDINQSHLDALEDETANATIRMQFFTDPDERKLGILRVNNNFRITIDTTDDSFSKKIPHEVLVAGSNSLRIEPDRTMDLLDMKLVLTCKDRDECG